MKKTGRLDSNLIKHSPLNLFGFLLICPHHFNIILSQRTNSLEGFPADAGVEDLIVPRFLISVNKGRGGKVKKLILNYMKKWNGMNRLLT
jgi:hypothetical protein